MAKIMSAMRVRQAHLHIRLWIEFVKSLANLSDDPSRNDYAGLEKEGAERIELVMPPYLTWDGSA